MPSGIKQEDFNYRQASLLLFFSLLLRIPFLYAGYGNEEDSWGSVVAAHNTFLTGIPEVSRLPGHPFYEGILSLLYPFSSPLLYNSLSAFFALLATWLFVRLCHDLQVKHYLAAGYGLSFSPLFFVDSVYTIDYVWALAFCFASARFWYKQRAIAAGICMGLAISCRITSAATIPAVLSLHMLSCSGNLKSFFYGLWNKKTLQYIATSCIVGLLMFLPVIYVYGLSFFDYSDQFPYPSAAKVFYKASLGVWGLPGLLSLLLLVPILLKKQGVWWWMLAVVQLFIYLRLPQKSAYLLPLAGFTFLFAAHVLPSKKQLLFFSLQVLSSLVLNVGLEDAQRGSDAVFPLYEKTVNGQQVFVDLLSGPVYGDYSKRITKMEFVSSVHKNLLHQNDSLALVSGWWYNQLLVESYEKPLPPFVLPVFYCSCDSLAQLRRLGYRIAYLPEQDTFNDLMFGGTCTGILGKAFQE